jgi:hypothetical protein
MEVLAGIARSLRRPSPLPFVAKVWLEMEMVWPMWLFDHCGFIFFIKPNKHKKVQAHVQDQI